MSRKDPQDKPVKVKKHPVLTKVILRVVTIIILAGIFLIGGNYLWKKWTQVTIERKNALVERSLISCSELVTVKYKYSDIVTIKKSNIFSKSYSIIRYSGIIRAGIENIEYTEFKLSPDGKSVEIILPDVTILGNELVEQSVFDEQQSIFVPIRTQEIFDEIETSRELMEETAISEGLLREARIQAENLVRTVLLSAGFESVVVW